jgi:hypothetical protein
VTTYYLQAWDDGLGWCTLNLADDMATLERYRDGWQGTAFPTSVFRVIAERDLRAELAAMPELEAEPIEASFAPLPSKRAMRKRIAEPA